LDDDAVDPEVVSAVFDAEALLVPVVDDVPYGLWKHQQMSAIPLAIAGCLKKKIKTAHGITSTQINRINAGTVLTLLAA